MNSQFSPRLQKLAKACAGLVMGIGLVEIVACLFDLSLLRSWIPAYGEIKLNGSICLVLAGLSLRLLQDERAKRRRRRLGYAAALFILAMGGMTLAEYLFDLNLRIDQLFLRDSSISTSSPFPPGRMSPHTAFNFILVALSLLTLNSEFSKERRPSQYFSLLSTVFPLQIAIAYLYGIHVPSQGPAFVSSSLITGQMPIPLIVSFLLFALASLFSRPRYGLMALVTNRSYAGSTIRKLLIPSIIIPPLLGGWVIWIFQAKRFHPGYGIATVSMMSMIIFTLLIGRNAKKIYQAEIRRQSIENYEQRIKTQRELAQTRASILESMTDAFIAFDESWRITGLNAKAEKLGGERGTLLGKDFWNEFPALKGTPIEAEYRHAVETQSSVEFEAYYEAWNKWFATKAYPAPEGGLSVYLKDITEQKTTGKELAYSRQMFERIIEVIPDLLYIYDLRAQRNVYFNRTTAKLLGYELDEAQKLEDVLFTELLHPEDLEVLKNKAHAIHSLGPGEVLEREYQVRHRDGSSRWFQSREVIFSRTTDGQVHQVLGLAEDITERKRSEIALKRSEARERARAKELEILMEALPAAVWIAHDPDCKTITGNRASYEVLQMPPNTNVALQSFSPGSPPAYRVFNEEGKEIEPNEFPLYRAAREGVEVRELEFKLILRDGSVKYVYGNAIPLFDELGRSCGAIGTYLDVTERKKTEAALTKSEKRLALSMGILQMGDWEWDIASDQLFLSAGVRTIFDLGQEVELTFSAWIQRIHPEDQEWVMTRMQASLLEQREYDVEYRICWKDGNIHWVAVKGHALYEKGKPVRMIGIALDITERRHFQETLREIEERRRLQTELARLEAFKELEQRVQERTIELRKMNERLTLEIAQRKLAEKEILEISERQRRRFGQELHDGLCQSLTGVAFMTKVLAKRLEAHRLLESEEAKKIGDLIRDSINQARDMAYGIYPFEIEPEELLHMLQELSSTIQSRYNIRCVFDCEGELCIEDSQIARHLYLIAQEAVANAIKHGKARSILISLSTSPAIELRVKDDGTGFSNVPEKVPGIGMHIMRYRARMMNATLEVDKGEEGGTCLTCSLAQTPEKASNAV